MQSILSESRSILTSNHQGDIPSHPANNYLHEISCHSSDSYDVYWRQHNCNLTEDHLISDTQDVPYSSDNTSPHKRFDGQLSDAAFPEWSCESHFTSQNHLTQSRRFLNKRNWSAERTGPQVCMLSQIVNLIVYLIMSCLLVNMTQ